MPVLGFYVEQSDSSGMGITHPTLVLGVITYDLFCRGRSCSVPALRTSMPGRRGGLVSAVSKSEPAVAPAATEFSSESARKDVLGALSQIIDPDFGTDIVSCGFVKELSIAQETGQVLLPSLEYELLGFEGSCCWD